MKPLVMCIGLLIAAVGILGIAAPSVLLAFGLSLLTTAGLYIIAAGRVLLGLLLLWVAPASRAPIVLRVLGVFAVIAGVITPFFGVERSRMVLDWWAGQSAAYIQIGMGFVIILGLFIVYAVAPRRQATT